MHIERRISLWHHVFQTTPSIYPTPEGRLEAHLRYVFRPYPFDFRNQIGSGIEDRDVTKSLVPWIAEALALEPAGMPKGSFQLVLDGDPAPTRCSDMWQKLQYDAHWQAVEHQAWERGLVPGRVPDGDNDYA
ncbi:Uu.00g079360.m01.CDS01 [Anthostomella pinea]|uniref:Uu.00g079360.m01.CDS01 n=1 Tax=Anthostomella pinea TaxID=933095 RepID=A0AAI8YJ77_9PEZI|nr:Uu.00g079360.m01.CDS01 [Anthostomella pinea]